MKALKIVGIAGVLMAAFAGSAQAQNMYVVGSVGQSSTNVDKAGIDSILIGAGITGLSSTGDDKDTGYKLQFGYQFNPNFAIEGGYIDLGKIKYTATATQGTLTLDAKASGWNVAAVGILPVNDAFSVFGKLGFINAEVKASAAASAPGIGGIVVSASDTSFKTTYGVGASYNFNKQFGMRIEYEKFNKLGDSNTTGENDVDLISAGVVFKF